MRKRPGVGRLERPLKPRERPGNPTAARKPARRKPAHPHRLASLPRNAIQLIANRVVDPADLVKLRMTSKGVQNAFPLPLGIREKPFASTPIGRAVETADLEKLHRLLASGARVRVDDPGLGEGLVHLLELVTFSTDPRSPPDAHLPHGVRHSGVFGPIPSRPVPYRVFKQVMDVLMRYVDESELWGLIIGRIIASLERTRWYSYEKLVWVRRMFRMIPSKLVIKDPGVGAIVTATTTESFQALQHIPRGQLRRLLRVPGVAKLYLLLVTYHDNTQRQQSKRALERFFDEGGRITQYAASAMVADRPQALMDHLKLAASRDPRRLFRSPGAERFLHRVTWANIDDDDRIDLLKHFLNHGARVNQRDDDGTTVLAHTDSVGTTRVVLEAGARPTLRDEAGKTALHHWIGSHAQWHYPVEEDDVTDMVDEVVRRRNRQDTNDSKLLNGFIDAPDHNGVTPVMLAAKHGLDDIVRHLVSKGARTNRVAKDGRSYAREIARALR